MTTEPQVIVLEPREVPLGGPRGMPVRRTLPHRSRPTVGAWCFADHYGPVRVGDGHPGMDVRPHPHIGLQTVSWLFSGEIEHRDSGGVVATVRPGELDLMTAGDGIAHSEVSAPGPDVLHGVQLWVALPHGSRAGGRGFDHHAPEPRELPGGGGSARVFLGELPGVDVSPVPVHTPLLGAQLDLEPDADVRLAVDRGFEHGVLLDTGAVEVEGRSLGRGAMAIVDDGPDVLRLRAGAEGARLVLLGGEPFGEDIVMWWNFVARDHDEIVRAREDWEARTARFGDVPGWSDDEWLHAPALPNARLRPRPARRPSPECQAHTDRADTH